jgi:capsule polysaccharide export protein KpsE/RkpR
MNHYEIDSRYPTTDLYKKYAKNINFKPTKFMSVKISVMDKDPQTAADIANKISDLTDTIFYEMQIKKANEAVKLVEHEYNEFKQEINKIEDSLIVIRSYGIVNYNAQSERYIEAYGNALINKNYDAAKKIEEKLNTLAKYGGGYNSLRDRQLILQKQLGILKVKYSEALLDANQRLSKKYVVNKATVAEKKSYPIRWLIVTISTLSAFILYIIFLLIDDSIRKNLTKFKDQL